ncbi:XTP/dITP diphosphatase [Candidatus Micrarchaeota archaeon]|nr:XTP/dITP diphosphatase [Candidatus Micrarchaeota archaeon]
MVFFATSNLNKFKEAEEILGKTGLEIKHFKFEHDEIRSDSLEDISIEAVGAAYDQTKKPVFVDDTGIFIEGLNEFPGAYSGWVIKKIGVGGILKLMDAVTNRNVVFRTCIAYQDKNIVKTFIGENKGKINSEPKGKSGFGYDSIFVPDGHTQTFAENIELKNKLSHRYKSLLLFSNYINSRNIEI